MRGKVDGDVGVQMGDDRWGEEGKVSGGGKGCGKLGENRELDITTCLR